MEILTHLHLLSRLRIRGAIPPFSYTSSWRGGHIPEDGILLSLIFSLSLYVQRHLLVWTQDLFLTITSLPLIIFSVGSLRRFKTRQGIYPWGPLSPAARKIAQRPSFQGTSHTHPQEISSKLKVGQSSLTALSHLHCNPSFISSLLERIPLVN
jgi:hypothetical protein